MRTLLHAVVVSLMVTVPLIAKDTTVILQNGLNGYEGCEDATVYNDFYDQTVGDLNFGSDTALKILYGKIDSGTTIDRNR